MPKKKKKKKKPAKKCQLCGRRLNSYNKTGICHFHTVPADATGEYDNTVGIGNTWLSLEGRSKTGS